MNKSANEHQLFMSKVVKLSLIILLSSRPNWSRWMSVWRDSKQYCIKTVTTAVNLHRMTKNKKYRTPARIKSNRTSGGQSGHKGTTLKRVAKADTIIEHKVSNCSYCGKSLKTIEPDSVSSRQVIDIPPMQQIVTEHRVEEKSCPSCHHVTQASFLPMWQIGTIWQAN